MTKETSAPIEQIDLASLDTATASDAGARIPIVHPISKEPVGIFIKVLGKHSTTFRELVRERINKRISRESMAAKRGKPLEPKTAEEIEREAIEMLIACTTGWETELYETVDQDGKLVKVVKETKPTILFNGQQLEFTHANGLTVYNQMLWLREQVDDAIGDLENFIQA